MKFFIKLIVGIPLGLAILLLGGIYTFWGMHGIHTFIRNGDFFWLPVGADSPRLSPSMRLALTSAPAATPGALTWQTISPGFEVADLPAVVNGTVVDHLYPRPDRPGPFSFRRLQRLRRRQGCRSVDGAPRRRVGGQRQLLFQLRSPRPTTPCRRNFARAEGLRCPGGRVCHLAHVHRHSRFGPRGLEDCVSRRR